MISTAFARNPGEFTLVAAEVKKEIELEIAYVLFIDIVGYSKLVTYEQRRLLELLNRNCSRSGTFSRGRGKASAHYRADW